MATPARKRLPVRPSEEHLKKQAKRRAKADGIGLAAAQRRLAIEYGARNWAGLMRVVETMRRGSDQIVDVKRTVEPLPAAVRARDVGTVRRLLAEGNFTPHDLDAALAHAAWYGGDAPDVLAVRKTLFDLLLDHGADPDGQYGSGYGPIVFGTGECLSPDGLQWLIDAGCDVTFGPVDTKYGPQCPLGAWLGTYAREAGNARKHRGLDLLLAHGAVVPPGVSPPVLTVHRGDAAALVAMIDADTALATRAFAELPYGHIDLHGGALLHCAAEFGEIDCVDVLLRAGAAPDGPADMRASPLWIACAGGCPADVGVALATRLLDAGAHVNRAGPDGSTALHHAARRGPVAMVELLLRRGAREWIGDDKGRLPRDYAARGVAEDKDVIVELLTRPVIRDPDFKAAVAAIHAGDVPALRRLLADHPNLATGRAVEPDCYPLGYFGNPKLLWFVAFNPTLAPTMPANIVNVAETIINAGVDAADLGYTLELAMTSDPAKDQGHLEPLMTLLLRCGATVTPQAILTTLGHGQTGAIETLLAHGVSLTAPIAAGLGRIDAVAGLLNGADAEMLHDTLSMAVINGQTEAARRCLDAGADVNRPLRVHTHSTPLHHAAGNGWADLVRLLLDHGADRATRDTLWNATPKQWAEHGKHSEIAGML